MPQLLVHGLWNVGGAKMSKNAGNVIDPFALAYKYGVEALRYYLISDIATGKDADFSEERLIERYNADLANSVGNLLNRSLTMIWKYSGGTIRRGAENTLFAKTGSKASLPEFRNDSVIASSKAYSAHMEAFTTEIVLYETFHIARSADFLIDIAAPWELAKDPARRDELGALLYHVCESLRIITILISPVLPKA